MKGRALLVLAIAAAVCLLLAAALCTRLRKRHAEGFPLVLAHRGLTELAPENSISAIREALGRGADGSELDVHLAKSGEVIVIHDSMIDRVTNGRGRVADLTLQEIQSFALNPDPGGRYTDERIPTLEEVFQAFGKKAVLFIEMKRPLGLEDAKDGLEEKVGELIDRYDLYQSTFVSSFNPTALALIKRSHPRVRTVLEYHNGPSGLPYPERLEAAGPIFAAGPEVKAITEEMVRWARREGYRLSTFSPVTLEEMERVAALDFDIVTTSRPDVYKRVLAGVFKPENLSRIPPVFFRNFEEPSAGLSGPGPLRISPSEEGKCLSVAVDGSGGAYAELPAKPDSLYFFELHMEARSEKTYGGAGVVGYLIEREQEARDEGRFLYADSRSAPDLKGLCAHHLISHPSAKGTLIDEGPQTFRMTLRTTYRTRSLCLALAGYQFDGTLRIDEIILRHLDD